MTSTHITAANGTEYNLETVAFINAIGKDSVRIEKVYATGDIKVLGSFPTQAKADAFVAAHAAKQVTHTQAPRHDDAVGSMLGLRSHARGTECHYCGLDRRTCDCH